MTLIIATLILSGICITLKALGLMDNEAEPEDETGDNAVENFLKRLPIEFQGATLYAVSSEDHYLRIHTDRGQELVLMRLADAMKELDAVDGCQTHRSWWVARVGIAKQFAKDGKPALMLKSGAIASISRSRKIAVREVLL